MIPVLPQLIENRSSALQLVVDDVLENRIPQERRELVTKLVEEPKPGHDQQRDDAGKQRNERDDPNA